MHLGSSECPQLYTNGNGSSELANEACAVLEFFERLSTNLFFFDDYLGNDTAEQDCVFYPTEEWFLIDASLSLFFNEQTLFGDKEIVAGKHPFHGLTFSGSWKNRSPAHQGFINIYRRLHPLWVA